MPRDAPDQDVKEPTGRTKQKRQDEAWDNQVMWDADTLGISNFPTPDEEIKSQIMDPSGQ